MKQILIATHGKMASGIRYTAEMIGGASDAITTIDAYVHAEDDVEKQFEEYFESHKDDRIIVVTDLMGGSVNQKLMGYVKPDKISLITGMNLPLVVQLLFADENITDAELQEYVKESREELQMVGVVAQESENENRSEETKQPPKPIEPESYENSNAKISALRIDDRLIHGQVAMTWTKQLRVQGIIVANDNAAGDNTQKMALQMAVPSGIRVLIKPVDEAIRILNYEKASKMRILVLTRTVADALKVRKSVGEIAFLNLGNTGRFDGIDISEKQVITPTIMLTKEEVAAAKELAELDPKFCMQQVPNDEQKLVKDVIGKL